MIATAPGNMLNKKMVYSKEDTVAHPLRRILVLGGVVLPLLFLFGCNETTTNVSTKPNTNASVKPAPDFTFTTLEGKTIKLSDLKGKPVVINFWASWCHFCVQEAPDLEALYKQYHGQGLEVLGVGTDDPTALGQKAQELGLTYPIGSNPKAAELYGVQGVPFNVFVDKEGNISDTIRGATSKENLKAEIKKIV